MRYAFSNTPLGGHVYIPNVATVGGNAFNHSEITGVEFGAALKSVGGYAFGYTDKLKDVVFAEGAKPTFTYYAFYAAGIESLYIPDGYNLGQRVFAGCTNLLYVTLGDDRMVIGRHGKIAKAIRSVIKAASAGTGKKVNVEIVDAE